jgi:hypothetical protein
MTTSLVLVQSVAVAVLVLFSILGAAQAGRSACLKSTLTEAETLFANNERLIALVEKQNVLISTIEKQRDEAIAMAKSVLETRNR